MSFNLSPNDDRLKMFTFAQVWQRTHAITSLVATQGQCVVFCVCVSLQVKDIHGQTLFFLYIMTETGPNTWLKVIGEVICQCGVHILMSGQSFYTKQGHQVLLTTTWKICSHPD